MPEKPEEKTSDWVTEWRNLIVEIVDERIKAYMEQVKLSRGWQTVKPWPPVETKGKKD